MNHSEIKALLHAFSLGILTSEERGFVENHLEHGCDECRDLVKEYYLTVGLLALNAEAKTPPPELREKILAQIPESGENGETERKQPLSKIVWGEDGVWEPLFPGIETKMLFKDSATGYKTALVKMEAGYQLPRHTHIGQEETYVVEGSCTNDGNEFSEGDFWQVESGYVHEVTETKHGCLLLVRFQEINFLTN